MYFSYIWHYTCISCGMSTYNKELIDWLIDWLIEHQRSSAAPRRLPRRRRRRKPLLGPAAAARRLLVVGGGGVWRREQLEWRLSHMQLLWKHCFVMCSLQYGDYRTQCTAEGSVFGAVSLWFFVCVWNTPGTAERICAIFTRKTCLVPRSEDFESQGQRSKVKVPRDKNGIFRPLRRPACGLCLV